MSIDVNTAALASQGASLAGEQSPPMVVPATFAGADPVSQSVATILCCRASGISAVLAHGDAVRAAGGAAVSSTAAGFTDLDAQNAGLFGNGGTAAGPSSLSSPSVPSLPDVPPILGMAPPPVMPGEAFARLLHQGPGGSALRDAAQELRGQAGSLREQAAAVQNVGTGIDASWQDDGRQQAGAKTALHGVWLQRMAEDTEQLASAFDHSADQHDRAREAAPTAEDFQLARQNLLNAQARMDPVSMAKAAADYSSLEARSTEAKFSYWGEASSTTAALGTPLQASPPITGPDDVIVGDGDNTVQAVDWRTGPPLPAEPPPNPPPMPAPAPTPPVTGEPIKLPQTPSAAPPSVINMNVDPGAAPPIMPNCSNTKQWVIIGQGVAGGLGVLGGALATPFTFGGGLVPVAGGLAALGDAAYEIGQCG